MCASTTTRADGRLPNQLRPLAAEPAALDRADGSARFSHDETRLLVACWGPGEAKRSREAPSHAVVQVIVRPVGGLPGPVEREMEQILAQTLEHLILLHLYPRACIQLVVQTLRSDGSFLAAALHGCCVAMMHAGIPLRGMLAGCTVALLPDGTALLDPCLDEELAAAAVVTLGYQLRRTLEGASERQLLLSHVRGAVTEAQYEECEAAAQEAAACVAAFCRQAMERSVGAAPPPGG